MMKMSALLQGSEVQVFIRDLKGHPVSIMVLLDAPIMTIAAKYCAKVGWSEESLPKMRFLIAGKQLKDNGKTIREWGIQKEYTVDLLLRLCGD